VTRSSPVSDDIETESAGVPEHPRRQMILDPIAHIGLLLVSVAAGLGLAALLLAVTGHNAADAYSEIWKGSFGSKASFFTTLEHTAPILIVAVGACIAGRSGLLNIGQEGQFLVGGLAATSVAVHLNHPRALVVTLMMLAGLIGGALWVGIAAVLRVRRGVSEVLTTLLLNFLAVQLVTWMVSRQYLLQASAAAGARATDRRPESPPIPGSARLPHLASGAGYALGISIVFAIAISVVVWVALTRSGWGFRVRATGANARAAERFGISTRRVRTAALLLSGALAGFAGSVFLSNDASRLTPGFAGNYGWEGLLVALVANFNAGVAVPVALVFGAVRAGGGLLSATGVSSNVIGIIQALVVLAVALPTSFIEWQRRTRLVA
jgi:ABC-type uncharacterized transport system permease subunit